MSWGGALFAAWPHCTAQLALQRWNLKAYPLPLAFSSMKETASAAWLASPQPQPYSSDSVSFPGFRISLKVRVSVPLG